MSSRQPKWHGTFSPNMKDESERLDFISRMAYLTFSQYLLYREFIPATIVHRRRIENMIIYVFNRDTRWGEKLSDLMKGMKDAITNKYLHKAFIMVSEDPDSNSLASEVISVSVAYDEEQCFKLEDNDGSSIASYECKTEEEFQIQVKHLLINIASITKKLKRPMKNPNPILFFKLTYYDHAPFDYQPPHFEACDSTYIFRTKDKNHHHIGSIRSNDCAMVFDLKSQYFPSKLDLGDITLNDAGSTVYERISAQDVTADESGIESDKEEQIVDGTGDKEPDSVEIARDDESSPILHSPDESYQIAMNVDSRSSRSCGYIPTEPASPIPLTRRRGTKRLHASICSRSLMRSPEDATNYHL